MTGRRAIAGVVGAGLPILAFVLVACSGGGGGAGPDAGAEGGSDATGDVSQDSPSRRDAVGDALSDPILIDGDALQPDTGAPFLTGLSVAKVSADDASTPATLVPAFSFDVHDYYVRCATGDNAFDVTMTAGPGALAKLVQPSASPSRASQTVRTSVAEGAAIVADAEMGGVDSEYWVRCLPADFPAMQLVTHPEAGAAAASYYLLGNQATVGGVSGYAMVLDANGVPVWFQRHPSGGIFVDVDDIVKGAISYLLFPQNPADIGIHTLSPPSTAYVTPKDGIDISRHELVALSSGHFLGLIPPNAYGIDCSGASLPVGDGGSLPLGSNMAIQDSVLVEFDLTGNVYWTWAGSAHIDCGKETTAALVAGYLPDGGPVIDSIHFNSIDLDPTDENHILVSARNTDALYYVDRTSGKVLWKMGGTAYAEDGATIVPVADAFREQHDARFQSGWSSTCAGGSGQISVFDDQSNTTSPARAVVYDVTLGGDAGVADCGVDGKGPAATRAWQYVGTHNSSGMGSYRVLSDGSRVIGWGIDNEPNLVFTEVDALGHDLADFYFTQNFGSYRVIKAPLSMFDLEVLRTTAGAP